MKQIELRDTAVIKSIDETRQLKEVIQKQKEEIELLQEINEKNAEYHKRINKILEEGGVILTKQQLQEIIRMR